MEFKDILAQFMATPTQDVDWDLYYEDSGITDEQIAQLRAAFETKLATQGAVNAKQTITAQ